MINIWKLERRTACDWDEYDAMIVAAFNSKEARKYCLKQADKSWIAADENQGLIIEQIGTSETLNPGIILASFNAG